MPSREEDYTTIIGMLVLGFVLILLLSTPGMILAKQVSVIDTELSHASGHETTVRTKMDFGNSTHVQAFPAEIADWHSVGCYNKSTLAGQLGADVVLSRDYSHPGAYQPVFLLIMQSDNRSSFHPPIVCYPALGYEIEEETTEEISVSNASWAESFAIPETKLGEVVKSKLNESRGPYFNGSISAKRLVVFKESGGKITERRVVLYFYVKDNPLAADTFTMIRVSSMAPLKGSLGGTLDYTKDFMGKVVPYLFEVREGEEIIAVRLAKSGIGGWLIIGALVSVPVGIIVYPRIKRRNKGSR